MTKKVKPSDIAAMVNFNIDVAMHFCSEVLEEVNAHNVSYVLGAINVGAYDLAKEFLDLDRDQVEAGLLTRELRERLEVLVDRLDNFYPGDEVEHVCDDDCRSYGCRRS